MQWLEPVTRERIAIAGDGAFERLDYAAAIAAYEQGAGAPDFTGWARLAESYLNLGRYPEALAACDRGATRGPGPALHYVRGQALRGLGLAGPGNAELRRAMSGRNLAPLKALLRDIAREADGARLLDFCDSLEPRHRATALVRAYRAVALSLLGRRAEANHMVDLHAHVVRRPLAPPSGYDGIEAFNHALATEILADPPPGPASETMINYAPCDGPAFAALLALTRAAMEDYAARLADMGLDVMPPPPAAARLITATTVLRGEGRNRQHIHPAGYISSVYHVAIPESIRTANDDAGALLLGPCNEAATGHRPCWGTRHIKPVEGWLTLFPSHLFHDVVPSRDPEPRISVACDLSPVEA